MFQHKLPNGNIIMHEGLPRDLAIKRMEDEARWCQDNNYSMTCLADNIMIAIVTPKSKKAQNRFCNLMDKLQECFVEQHLGDKVFLTSANNQNHFWVNLIDDNDWQI
jgi:hypothetical protein